MLPQISVVRLADAQKMPLPSYADGIGTCMVLRSTSTEAVKIAPRRSEVFSTGLSIALPVGMEAQIRSLKESTQTGIIVLNAPLTIDASDRSEIKVCLYNSTQESIIIKKGDPIALMVFSLVLRINWNDLTPKIEEKIQLTQAENQVQMKIEEQKKKEQMQMVQDVLAEDTPILENSFPATVDTLYEENAYNQIMTSTEEVTLPAEETVQPNKILEKNDVQEVLNDGLIENNTFYPVTENESNLETLKTEEQFIAVVEKNDDVNILEEKHQPEQTNLNEPIAPPAILAEFEKIETEFENKQLEDKV